jgi:hypothetical protein
MLDALTPWPPDSIACAEADLTGHRVGDVQDKWLRSFVSHLVLQKPPPAHMRHPTVESPARPLPGDDSPSIFVAVTPQPLVSPAPPPPPPSLPSKPSSAVSARSSRRSDESRVTPALEDALAKLVAEVDTIWDQVEQVCEEPPRGHHPLAEDKSPDAPHVTPQPDDDDTPEPLLGARTAA